MWFCKDSIFAKHVLSQMNIVLYTGVIFLTISKKYLAYFCGFQIELYNSMVEKEGMDGEKDAMKAYIAAREESENDKEVAEGDEVSSALIERVSNLFSIFC